MPSRRLVNLPTGVCVTPKPPTPSPLPMATFCRVTQPSTTDDGLYAAGLRFGEARVMTVPAALVGFCHLVRGFRNRQMVERVRALWAAPTPHVKRRTICAGSNVKA